MGIMTAAQGLNKKHGTPVLRNKWVIFGGKIVLPRKY